MTPHITGTGYEAGVREILECWFDKRPTRPEYLIADAGELAGTGAHSYSAGDATKGSDGTARQ
jgi:formate dehydrogenase